jgi:tetratricopeptide (TPR) repeat protein
MSSRIILTLCLCFSFLFLQGCGIAGAYIYFGDLAYKDYQKASKQRKTEEAKGALQRAFDNYKASITYDETGYPEVYIKLAEFEEKLTGNLKQSQTWIAKGLEKIPDNPDLQAELGKYTFKLAADDIAKNSGLTSSTYSFDNHDGLNAAKSHYRDALSKNSIKPSYHAGLATILLWEIEQNLINGNTLKNSYLFQRVNDLLEAGKDPESASFDIMLAQGIYSFLKNDYNETITSLSEILKQSDKLDIDSKERTLYYLTRAYVETQKYDEAIELASQALDDFPDDVRFLGERVIAYFKKDQMTLAKSDLELIDSLTDQYHEFYYRVGTLYSKKNLADKAEIYLLKAYRLQPQNAKYAFALGKNSILQKKLSTAKNFFEKAIQLAIPKSDLERDARHALSQVSM